MSDGGKGSKPRPYSIAHDEYTKRWDAIFCRDLPEDNTGTSKNEYQDVLRTEDCIVDSDTKITRYNEETQYVKTITK